MKKWLFAIFILLTGCASEDTESKEPTPETDTEEAASKETIAVDKGIFNVDVTVPKSLFEMEDGDVEEVKASAEEEGIGEVIDNGDGTITYQMSKSKHREMMREMESEIEASMEDILESGDYASIEGLTANDDYSEFTLEVSRTKYEESFDGFAVFGIGVLGLYYQLFDGADAENYSTVIRLVDTSNKEEFDRLEFPQVFEQMEETEEQLDAE